MAQAKIFQSTSIRRYLSGRIGTQRRYRTTSDWALGRLTLGLLTLLVLGLPYSEPSTVQAHSSGPPKLANAAAGPYRIFAWTQPEPLRVGDAHISVLVTLAATAQPVDNVQVKVHFVAQHEPSKDFVVLTAPQEFLSNRYYEADVQLPSTGLWRAIMNISGPEGEGSVSFDSEVLAAHSLNWWLIGGAGAALSLLLGLIGIWSRLQAKVQPTATQARVARNMRVSRDIRAESK
ncbi:MAG: hypothetical protein U0350_45570 [Caldilineaceae bacterium]